MKDNVRATDHRQDFFIVADVGDMQLDPRPNLSQVLLRSREKIVDHMHFAIALRDEPADEGRADEAGAARYDIFFHEPSFAISPVINRSESPAAFSGPGEKSKASSEI